MTQIPELLEIGGSVTESNQWGLLCWRRCLGKACQLHAEVKQEPNLILIPSEK